MWAPSHILFTIGFVKQQGSQSMKPQRRVTRGIGACWQKMCSVFVLQLQALMVPCSRLFNWFPEINLEDFFNTRISSRLVSITRRQWFSLPRVFWNAACLTGVSRGQEEYPPASKNVIPWTQETLPKWLRSGSGMVPRAWKLAEALEEHANEAASVFG